MSRHDDDMKRDLTDAFDGEFDRERLIAGVADRIVEDGGGEHEISAAPVRLSPRPAVWGAVIAAAAALLVATFLVTRPTGDGGVEGGVSLAGGGEIGAGGEVDASPLVIEIRKDEFVVEGESFDASGLKALLEERARATREAPDAPSDQRVLFRAGRDIPWKRVQLAMQACADPRVRIWKLQFDGLPPMYAPSGEQRPAEPVDLATLQVDVAWPGATAEKVEREVALRIEGALLTVPGLQGVDSESRAGRCEIVLILNPGADKAETVRRVRNVFGRIQDRLPAGVKLLRIGDGPEMQEVPLDVPGEVIDPLSEEVKPEIEEQKPIGQGPAGDPTIRDAKVSDHNEVEDGPPSKLAPTPPMRVHARLRMHEKKIQLNIGNPRLGGHWYPLEKGLEMMGPFIATCRKQSDEIEAVIEAAGDVPHAAVVKLIDAFMKREVVDITFKGTPPK